MVLPDPKKGLIIGVDPGISHLLKQARVIIHKQGVESRSGRIRVFWWDPDPFYSKGKKLKRKKVKVIKIR